MQALTLHADARASAREAVRSEFLERRLARYQPRFQTRVRAAAERHPRLKDLAGSFPALLFALAVPRTGFDPEPAIARVIAGAPLRDLAAAADVAQWLRSFAPEAIAAAIPRLPDSASFRRQIMNHVPRKPTFVPVWLQAVSDANDWADEGVAIWIARELKRDLKKVRLRELRWICLWAWYSVRPGIDACKPERMWTPIVQFESAQRAALTWRADVLLFLDVGEARIADMWFKPGSADGLDFVPLSSFKDIADEASTMKHCVRSYGEVIAQNRCRLWGVRQNGERVATLEVGRLRGNPLPYVVQLKGKHDKPVAGEVWQAARRWLGEQEFDARAVRQYAWDQTPVRRAAWIKLWRPYWLAKRGFPTWLPLKPSRAVLNKL